MTASPDAQPLRFENLEEAVSALRERGLRLSTARRLILEAFFSAEGPVSAIHLARTLSLEESSVYRNLETLEGNGVIRHVHFGHGPGLYVLLGGDESEYLYCSRCGKVTALAPEQLDAARDAIRSAAGYATRFTHFAIVGLCETCAAGSATNRGKNAGFGDAKAETHSHGDFVHTHARERAETLGHRH